MPKNNIGAATVRIRCAPGESVTKLLVATARQATRTAATMLGAPNGLRSGYHSVANIKPSCVMHN